MGRRRRRERRVDRPRIVGTLEERITLLVMGKVVVDALTTIHHDIEFDHDALSHVRLGFLREPEDRVGGVCSYSSRRPRDATLHQERHGVHRILIVRNHMGRDNWADGIDIIHHEFVHAILGDAEGHGPIFRRHNERIGKHMTDLLKSLSNHLDGII